MDDSQTQADVIAREIRALGLDDFDLTLLVLSPDGSKVIAQVKVPQTQNIPIILQGMATRMTMEGQSKVLHLDVDRICPGGVCYASGSDRPAFRVNQVSRSQVTDRRDADIPPVATPVIKSNHNNRPNIQHTPVKPGRRFSPPSLQDIQNAQLGTMDNQPLQDTQNNVQQHIPPPTINRVVPQQQISNPIPQQQHNQISTRSPMIISGYVSHRGITFERPEDLPRSYNGKEKNALVKTSKTSGVFTYISGKWNRCQIRGRCLFYDLQAKKFYSIMSLDEVIRDEDSSVVKDLEIPVHDGDMLLDGNYGQIYVYVGGKWHCDERCNIRENSRNACRSMRVDRSMVIPSSVTHLFVSATGSHLTITLPSTDNYNKYETDEGVITEMNPITISNIGSRDVIIIPSDGDTFFNPKQTTTKLGRRETMKLVPCSNTWFPTGS
jgi:hypothetical protein